MPVEKSSLFGKHANRLKGAHAAHKGDTDTLQNSGDLPAGVQGIAELVELKIGQYKDGAGLKGEPFFYAAGIVQEPKEFTDENGTSWKIAGLRTSIMEPLCDTPTRSRKTFEDHYAYVLGVLRTYGLDTNAVEGNEEALTAAMDALSRAGIYFQFRTWRGKKKSPGDAGYNEKYDGPDAPPPRVQHTWMQQTEFTPDAESVVKDKTAKPSSAAPKASANGNPKPAPTAQKSAPEPEPKEADLDELAALVDESNDDDARQRLEELASEAGISEEAVGDAESWAAVVELIRGAGEEKEGENANADGALDDKSAEDWVPGVGEMYNFRPISAKTKKPAAKPVEVEVTAVNKKLKTVDLKNNDDGKTVYKGVKWDDLETAT